ncbi:MAG: phage portal protein [Alphaproteobacteria bacterium]
MSLIAAWRGLVGRETKASKAGPLLTMQQPGRAVWTPRRFDSFAEEGYRKNVIAFRAINLVTRAAASVPWRLFRRGRGGVSAVASHALLDLLKRPNPVMARSEFIEAVAGLFLIAGNIYIEAEAGETGERE